MPRNAIDTDTFVVIFVFCCFIRTGSNWIHFSSFLFAVYSASEMKQHSQKSSVFVSAQHFMRVCMDQDVAAKQTRMALFEFSWRPVFIFDVLNGFVFRLIWLGCWLPTHPTIPFSYIPFVVWYIHIRIVFVLKWRERGKKNADIQ